MERAETRRRWWRGLGPAGRACGFSALCLATLALLHRIGWPHYEAEEQARIEAIVAAPDRVEAAVFGSSHAQAINLEAMGLEGENFFMVTQDMFETAYGVRALSPYLPRLRLALVSVSYFTFLNDNGRFLRGGAHTRSVLRARMYARYPFTTDYIRGDTGNFLLGLLRPVITEDHWRRVFEQPRWHGPPPPAPPPRRQRSPLDLEAVRREIAGATAERSREWLTQYARSHCDADRVTTALMLEANPQVTEQARAEAIRLAGELRARGVRVVFFTPPFYRAHTEACEAWWRELMLDQLQLVTRASCAEYYDHSTDPELANDNRLFVNADHLNGRGARLFSLLLLEQLEAAEESVESSACTASGTRGQRRAWPWPWP